MHIGRVVRRWLVESRNDCFTRAGLPKGNRVGHRCLLGCFPELLESRTLLSAYTFDDEFNGTVGSGPSSAWGAGNATDPNNSAVIYTNTTPAKATASNPATLQIISDPLANDGKALAMSLMPDPASGKSGDYVSSEITTEFDPTGAGNGLEYGHIEARIKIPGGNNSAAIWPAFWMLGDNITSVGWPATGEIDIMENDGAHPGTIGSHLHGPASGGGDYNGGAGIGGDFTLANNASFYSAYHVFAADWGPSSVTFSVDGVPYETLTPANVPAGGTWPFNGHPFYIILDVCEGGSFAPGTITSTQTMDVDYVHATAYSTAPAPPLVDQDIGSPSIAGSADFDGLTYTLNGASTDVWGTSDQFNFDSQSITGNATLITQVDWVGETGTYAKGGLMIRNGTAANASYAFLSLNPSKIDGSGNGAANFEFRTTAGVASVSGGIITGEDLANGPIWLKLVRSGNTLSGSVSSNDINWTLVGSTSITMNSAVQVGLADSSNNPSELCSDTFTSLSILPGGFGDTNLNTPDRIGTSGYNNSSWTLSGGGTGFAGATDQFNLVSESVTGDTSIAAEVTSQSSTNSSAMAGVMLRSNTSNGSAFAAAVVTPGIGAEFLWRASNGSTGSVIVAAKVAPLWLELTRVGSNITASYSSNGTSWTQIGTPVNPALSSTALAGLAVTSADTVTANTASFTNVDVLGVQTAASANPSTVTGTTTNLSAAASELFNSSGVIYTWAATNVPSGAVAPVFSVNGSAAAASTTATFSKAGSYTFTVTMTSPTGASITSSVNATVSQTATSIAVSPAASTISDGQTAQLSATLLDQFGNPMANQPGSFDWSIQSGAGMISSSGLYSAPSAGPASATILASDANYTGTASITTLLSVINGTSGADTIRLARSGSNLNVYINSNTPTYTTAFAPLGAISINSIGGNDTIVLDLSSGLSPIPSAGVTVIGGTGSTTLSILGSSGPDTVTITDATDITVDGAPVVYQNIKAISFAGNGGADTLTQAAQPGNGAALSFDGGSSDTLNISSGRYIIPASSIGNVAPYSLGSLLIGSNANVTIADAASAANRTVLMLGDLQIAGSMDLEDNDLVVHNGNLAQLTSEIAEGYADGNWTGGGITSSDAAASANHLVSLGVILNNNGTGTPLYGTAAALGLFDSQNVINTDVLIKYTYYGDANLDGKVDGSDYSRIDAASSNPPSSGWFNGDFNYSDQVDGSDYTLIDNAFNTQGAVATSAIAVASTPPASDRSSEAFAPIQWAANPVFSNRPIATAELLPEFDSDVLDRLLSNDSRLP
jgi:beta-glucanase (GH16 family)